MGLRGIWWRVWLAAAMVLALLLPAPAVAAATGPCHAAAAADEAYAEVAADPARWSCGPDGLSLAPARTFLRFTLAPGEAPTHFVTRLTRFETMHLTVIDRDGRAASREVGEDAMRPASVGWLMRTALPRVSGPQVSGPQVSGPGMPGPVATVVIRIDRPRHLGMLGDARLSGEDGGTANAVRELLFAGLCGLLFAPFLFNFAFYRVLRQRFLIWHTLSVACMAIQTLVVTGLINRFVTLSIFELCLLSVLTFGGGVAAAALFAVDLIEPEKLDPIHRRVLVAVAPWVTVFSAFYFLADGALRPFAPEVYFPSFIPVLAVFAWVMAVALRRGSRAVKFQIVAWLPIMAVGLVRVASNLGATAIPLDLDFEQHLAIVAEIMLTALGVVDRFMVLKQQRDQARDSFEQLEGEAGLDPLTGLHNRRGIEARFVELRSAGYDTLAVVDLDHFKEVNDACGHATGDSVLAATGLALRDDPDLIAWRLGGEEFLLLLRGRNSLARAEARRQAISARVAALVPGLPGPVTASMGVVELPRGAMLATGYGELYARADRLLYEAKHGGRNRMVAEKLTVFVGKDRRRKAAA